MMIKGDVTTSTKEATDHSASREDALVILKEAKRAQDGSLFLEVPFDYATHQTSSDAVAEHAQKLELRSGTKFFGEARWDNGNPDIVVVALDKTMLLREAGLPSEAAQLNEVKAKNNIIEKV